MAELDRQFTSDVRADIMDASRKLAVVATTITLKNMETFVTIVDYFNTQGWMPSLRNLGDELEIESTSGVSERLKQLQELGLIEREPNESKMRITPLGKLVYRLIDNQLEKIENPD